MQAKRNLDEAYCSVKMNYLNQHVCPHIIDYYGFTAVRQPVQKAHYFLEPPLLLQIHMELMACECIAIFSCTVIKVTMKPVYMDTLESVISGLVIKEF